MKDFKNKSVCTGSTPEECMEILFGLIGDNCTDNERRDIEKAYQLANSAHEGQKRLSGEPYIMHPLSVAIILASLGMDQASIIAALLHDTVEDTTLTYDQVEKEFGEKRGSYANQNGDECLHAEQNGSGNRCRKERDDNVSHNALCRVFGLNMRSR